MTVDWNRRTSVEGPNPAAHQDAVGPGKGTLTDRLPAIQRKADGIASGDVHGAAAHGTSGSSTQLPHLDSIQQAFGRHDVRHVQAHVGGAAAEGAATMGAEAFATGDRVAFARQPDLHTAAHEAAHVVQQRAGVHLKGGVGAEGDAYEHHADAVADRVVQGQSAEHLLDQMAPSAGGGGASAVQRKITIKSGGDANASSQAAPASQPAAGKKGKKAAPAPSVVLREATQQDVDAFLERYGVLARSGEIYQRVLDSKPKALRAKAEAEGVDKAEAVDTKDVVETWVSLQGSDATPYPYEDDERGAQKLLRDAYKYWLHTKYQWNSVGVAEYMTGDATGLAMAPIADEHLTIKMLLGPQKTNPPKQGESFLKPAPADADAKNRDAARLPDAFQPAMKSGQVVFNHAAENEKKQLNGTDELYRRRYNVHDKEDPVKPWNHETHLATSTIGTGLADPTTAARLRAQLQLGAGSEADDKRAKVEAYKRKLDGAIGNKRCLVLWGRTSGRDKPGGAHKELDSHRAMIQQLADGLRDKFADRMLVFVGDDALSKEEFEGPGLTNERLYVGKFWNDPEFGPALRDREAQRYLFELFSKENDAISIGMRSGSLEGLALLGMRVVFIDDLGNNAAGRMEAWSGDAANGRAAAYARGEGTTHEDERSGPLPSYKRIATVQQMGNQIDERNHTLAKLRATANRLRTEVDATQASYMSDAGTKQGNAAMEAVFAQVHAIEALLDRPATIGDEGRAGRDPEAQRAAEREEAGRIRKELDAAYNELAKASARLEAVEYGGQGSTDGYYFNADDVRAAIARMEALPDSPAKATALEKLRSLDALRDAANQPRVNDKPSSPPMRALLNQKAAEGFNRAFDAQEGKMRGDAVAGQKVRAADVEELEAKIAALIGRNVLQPSEVGQVTSLVGQMAKPAAPQTPAVPAAHPTPSGTFSSGWLGMRTTGFRA